MLGPIRTARPDECKEPVPVLLPAECSVPAQRWRQSRLSATVYRMDDGAALVGAAIMKWSR